MLKRSLFGRCMLCLLMLLCTVAAYGGPLSLAERKQDARLEKPVTLLSPRVYYLGELLEELSRQTGVALRADDKDKAAGELVVLRVDNKPLADVMNALWSLVNYRGATWDWNVLSSPAPSSAAGHPAYQLLRPREAQRLGAKLRQQIQNDFEQQATEILGSLDTTAENLEEMKKNSTEGLYVAHLRTHMAQKAFAELFSSDEARLRVLRGHDNGLIPVSALGKEAQAYVESEFALKKQWNPQLVIAKPTHVKVVRSQMGGLLTPSMMFRIGNERRMEGASCFGGTEFEKKWRQALTPQWLLDGDATEDPALELKVMAPRADAQPPPMRLNTPEMHLWQSAEGASLSFIACLSYTSRNDRDVPYGKTVRAVLKAMPPLESKWRNGFLLVHDPTWFAWETEEGRISWAALKRLHEAEKNAKDGLLPLTTLAEAARELSPQQLNNMSGEFPALGIVARWHSWFAQMGHTPRLIERLQSSRGVPVQVMRVPSTAVLPPKITADKVAAVRMRVTDYPRKDEEPAHRTIAFELLDTGGKALGHSAFYYQERWRPASQKNSEPLP